MAFECQQCGECCTHMGQVHTIEKDLGNNEFLICNQYTGEENIVKVDEDKIRLFMQKGIFERFPEACPFLREEPETGKVRCTIHMTRPGICRDFGCWRILILDSRGNRAGRITRNSRYLSSEDMLLRKIWNKCMEDGDKMSEEEWSDLFILTAKKAGYIVKR